MCVHTWVVRFLQLNRLDFVSTNCIITLKERKKQCKQKTILLFLISTSLKLLILLWYTTALFLEFPLSFNPSPTRTIDLIPYEAH